MHGPIKYSVIVPVLDEENTVIQLCGAIREVMEKMGMPYEIIFVDDGSKDSTVEKFKQALPTSPSLAVIVLAGHAGKAQALQAGFDYARGEIYITLDGDGQDDPREIPKLLGRMQEGYDVVLGWRATRKDPVKKKIASRIAHLVRIVTTREKIHDVGCALRVFKRQTVADICLWGGLHRFFSFIMTQKGYAVAEVKVAHHFRRKGMSKYGVWDRLKEGAMDSWRIAFVDLNKLMDHPRTYRIKEVLTCPSSCATCPNT